MDCFGSPTKNSRPGSGGGRWPATAGAAGRRRGATRSPPGWGRCPGTRRAGAGCSARAAQRGPSWPETGWRSMSRARTSRSWKARRPSRRRCSAVATVKVATRAANRRRPPRPGVCSASAHRAMAALACWRRGSRPPAQGPPFQHLAQLPILPIGLAARRWSARSWSRGVSASSSCRASGSRAARASTSLSPSAPCTRSPATASTSSTMSRTSSSCTGGTGLPTTCSATRSQLRSNSSATSRRASIGLRTSSRSSSACSSSGAAASASSSRSPSTKAAHRSSKASCEATSSATSTLGGSPACSGCSVRRRWAKACSVLTAAPSRSWSAWRARSAATSSPWRSTASSSRRTLSRSSAAALSVKVMAAICPIGTAARVDEGDDAIDERPRLAGPGARLHEERGVELVDDARPLAGIGWCRRGDRDLSHRRLVHGPLGPAGPSPPSSASSASSTGSAPGVGGTPPARGSVLAVPAPLELGGAEAVRVAGAAADEAREAHVVARSGREHTGLDAVGDDRQRLRPARRRGSSTSKVVALGSAPLPASGLTKAYRAVTGSGSLPASRTAWAARA